MTTALVPHAGKEEIGREQIELLKRTICAGSTDDELSMFVQTAQRLHLDPFARQVFAVKRWDSRAKREVMAIQVSIDGFRLVAERTGKYAGQLGPFWCGEDGEWRDVWLSDKPPAAAKVGVLRHDFKEPVWSVATWASYRQTKNDGGLSPMWAKFGPLMLGKCAEGLSLRRAFPNELSDVYSPEEMAQATPAGEPEYVPPPKAPPAPRANTVKHTGEKASPEAVKMLHTLRAKVGGLVVCDAKAPCPYPNKKRCGYHTQLAAFKDSDGNPVLSSKDLSPEQIANLIGRYEKKITEQGMRAQQEPDLGAALGDRDPGCDDEPPMADAGDLADLEDAARKRWGDGFAPKFNQWLAGAFDYDSVLQLHKQEAIDAVRMLGEGK